MVQCISVGCQRSMKVKQRDKMVSDIRNYKNPQLSVKIGSLRHIIESHSSDFLYLDPPYYLEKDGDNKMFKGIYPNGILMFIMVDLTMNF